MNWTYPQKQQLKMRWPRMLFYFATLVLVCLSIGNVRARDISGTITGTLAITEDSKLVGDVTCTVVGAPCISFGASNLTLDLNGFTVTGLADPHTTCSAGPTTFVVGSVEDGIELNAQANGTVRGPGIVQQFRGPGVFAINSSNLTVTGITTANNCMSGILVGGGSNHNIADNISVRNGSRTFACGGI
jgi:hypothetical protein